MTGVSYLLPRVCTVSACLFPGFRFFFFLFYVLVSAQVTTEEKESEREWRSERGDQTKVTVLGEFRFPKVCIILWNFIFLIWILNYGFMSRSIWSLISFGPIFGGLMQKVFDFADHCGCEFGFQSSIKIMRFWVNLGSVSTKILVSINNSLIVIPFVFTFLTISIDFPIR